MRRDQLEHIVRASSEIAGDPEVVVFGSQAILCSYDDTVLPAEAIGSIEADVTFFDDEKREKADAGVPDRLPNVARRFYKRSVFVVSDPATRGDGAASTTRRVSPPCVTRFSGRVPFVTKHSRTVRATQH